MSAITAQQARDEMYAEAFNAISTEAPNTIGYMPELRFKGVSEAQAPDNSKTWLRFSLQTVVETQSSLSSDVSAHGLKRFTVDGLFYLQMFIPASKTDELEKAEKLAQEIKNALRKHKGDVTLRNVRVIPLPEENLLYRLNVVAEYEHDEFA